MSQNSEITAILTGEQLMAADTVNRRWPSRDEIAELAYAFYERRGHLDGHDVDDWLSAEIQLIRHYE